VSRGRIWTRTITDTVYRADITIVICELDELWGYLTTRGLHDVMPAELAPSAGKTFESHLRQRDIEISEWYLWLPDWNPHGSPQEHLEQWFTLTHETVHLTAQVLRRYGVILSRESEEAYAYYYEALLRTMIRGLHDYKRRPHKSVKSSKHRK
jgi:hypothetical protein